MRASNWRSDIFFVIELGLDSPFHITVKPRKISDFFGFVKIPAQNLLLPSVPILYSLYSTCLLVYSNIVVISMRVRNCPLKDSNGRVFMNKHEYGHLMVR